MELDAGTRRNRRRSVVGMSAAVALLLLAATALAVGRGDAADIAFPDLPSTPLSEWPARGPEAKDPELLAEATDVWQKSTVTTLSAVRLLYADTDAQPADGAMPHRVVILTGQDSTHIQRIALLTEPDDPSRRARLVVRDDEPAPYTQLTGPALPDRPLNVTGSIVFVIRAVRRDSTTGRTESPADPGWVAVSLAEPGYRLHADEPAAGHPRNSKAPPPVIFAETACVLNPIVEDWVYYGTKLIGVRYLDAKLPR